MLNWLLETKKKCVVIWNNMINWLFGTKDSCELDPIVFEGTSTDLLQKVGQELPPKEEEEIKSDQTWMNIELLKMALEIEASKKQKMLFYVDVGSMTKKMAETYIKELKAHSIDKDGDYWLPRKEGGRGTEISMSPGRVTLDDILKTAQKLKDFVKK